VRNIKLIKPGCATSASVRYDMCVLAEGICVDPDSQQGGGESHNVLNEVIKTAIGEE